MKSKFMSLQYTSSIYYAHCQKSFFLARFSKCLLGKNHSLAAEYAIGWNFVNVGKMPERCRNDERYLTLFSNVRYLTSFRHLSDNNLTLLSNVRLLFSNVRYLTSFRRLSDVYKIPTIVMTWIWYI